jgi:hypothetical protein
VQANRRLQIRPVEALAEQPAKLAIHADIDFGVGQLGHIGQMAAKREGEIDLCANAFDQAADFGQIRRRVEGAVNRSNDIDRGASRLLCAA